MQGGYYVQGGGLGAQGAVGGAGGAGMQGGAGGFRAGGMGGGGGAGGMAGGAMAGRMSPAGGVFVGGAGYNGLAGGGAAGGAGSGGCGCGGPGCLGCGVSCGDAVGCGGGTAVGGSLAYVGNGGGDWVTETTYKYVGQGAGNLTAVVPQRGSALPCVVLLVVLAVAALVLLLMPNEVATTTTLFIAPLPQIITTRAPVKPAAEIKTCLFWGDPHIVTFDGARPSFYGDGEYWIVKNDQVYIQGRYSGTKYTYGLAATQKVAIGGPFLQDHTIEVEPMEHAYGGQILVDGTPVLNDFGQHRIGNVATIDYNGYGELVDEAASVWTTRAVHLSLPLGVHMTIFRWGNYLDMKITMPKLEGEVDGSCGNFNDDVSDDTPVAIFQRIGARTQRSESLFSSAMVVAMSTEESTMLTKQCPQQTLTNAEATCYKEIQGASEAQIQSCSFDICFGMNEHALRSAKNYATVAEEHAAHSKDAE